MEGCLYASIWNAAQSSKGSDVFYATLDGSVSNISNAALGARLLDIIKKLHAPFRVWQKDFQEGTKTYIQTYTQRLFSHSPLSLVISVCRCGYRFYVIRLVVMINLLRRLSSLENVLKSELLLTIEQALLRDVSSLTCTSAATNTAIILAGSFHLKPIIHVV